ncbi:MULTISPECIES: hypothetical protein [Bradyrhizobium]|nr:MULTISPECIES: hypothetical protein [Bradyrhizobium]MCP1833818.1 hypothetical protein [Bradyrhizobium sp. USDA 4545]MCP1852680.1 hypothetical protein [Bradyrhizobium sp. USDA 4541]MCP1918563.1 hypothetical protein [Bradyrhizobium sp. USDA 4532]
MESPTAMSVIAVEQPSARIPLSVKIGFSAFMAVLVPVYTYCYGPTNFLYFCDVCLILTLIGVWTESALLISMCAVGLLVPQTFWVIDFLAHVAGCSLTGMTDYMFDQNLSLFLRFLSGFHGWLPFLLLFLVWRLGYDQRALIAWGVLAWALLLICYFVMPGPRPDPGMTPVNINYVFGTSDRAAQGFVPPLVWLAGLMIGLPLLAFIPTHFMLRRAAPPM